MPTVEAISDAGCRSYLMLDDDESSICFPPHYLKALKDVDVTPCISYNVLEKEDGDYFLQEVALVPVE